ncbi:MAG: biotin/lipoyl-binding protein [Singulisphaera sp.]
MVAALAVAQGVAVSQPLVREVSDFVDLVGHVEAAQTIEIRARVGGTLVKVFPQAEQEIEKGGLLFEIDPRPYQADMVKAEAEVKRSEAQLKRLSAGVQRAISLLAVERISREEFDH